MNDFLNNLSAFLVTPLGIMLFLILWRLRKSGDTNSLNNVDLRERVACPACSEYVVVGANRCPHCGSELNEFWDRRATEIEREKARLEQEQQDAAEEAEQLRIKSLEDERTRIEALTKPHYPEVSTPAPKPPLKLLGLVTVVLVALGFLGMNVPVWIENQTNANIRERLPEVQLWAVSAIQRCTNGEFSVNSEIRDLSLLIEASTSDLTGEYKNSSIWDIPAEGFWDCFDSNFFRNTYIPTNSQPGPAQDTDFVSAAWDRAEDPLVRVGLTWTAGANGTGVIKYRFLFMRDYMTQLKQK